MDPVVHFEMPAEDKKRMVNFYKSAFGWEANFLGKEMGEYVVVMTTKCDNNGFPIQRGVINGGFYQKTEEMPMQYPSVVISVDDVNASMKKIKVAGGKVLGEPMDIPGVGRYVSFVDTEGNRVSIMQPTKEWMDKTPQD